MPIKLDSKFVAIMKEKGGPKTTQHENAIAQSAMTKRVSFFLLERFLRVIARIFIKISLL